MYDINYLAVIVSAVVFFVIGAIWYNDAVFGKAWRASMGKTDAEFEKENGDRKENSYESVATYCM